MSRSGLEEENTDAGQGVSEDDDSSLVLLIAIAGRVIAHPLPSATTATIGRGRDCDVVIDHASVSRCHAAIDAASRTVVDRRSRNGTRLRGQLIEAGVPQSVAIGEALQLGEVTVMLHRATAPALEQGQGTCALEQRPLEVRLVEETARSARNGLPFTHVRIHVPSIVADDARELLLESLRTSDVLAEPLPGQFQLLLPDLDGPRARPVVQRLVSQLETLEVRVASGIASYPADGITAVQLSARARELVRARGRAEPTPMDRIRTLTSQVAASTVSVLFTGETGVGKELFAEQLHRLSGRGRAAFIKINCAAIPENLLESELFGHVRGAFTGADHARVGLIEAADGGTLFLDEIGEMALRLQATLLRVLEEGIVRPVGATEGRNVDVRFVCATNRSLLDEIEAGRFRQDLYYRIGAITVALPPLRERRGEIEGIARAFAALARGRVGRAGSIFSDEAIALIGSHRWDGNIRELRNAVERAVLLAGDGPVEPWHLGLSAPRPTTTVDEAEPATRPIAAPVGLGDGGGRPPSRPTLPSIGADRLADAVAALERERILEALAQCGGNQTRAAKLLGLARNTLIARLDEYGLRRPRKA